MEISRTLDPAKCFALVISVIAFGCLISLVVMATICSNFLCPPEVVCPQNQPGNALQPDPDHILNSNSPTNDITPPRVVLEQSTRPIKIVEIDSPDKLLADVFQRAPTERVSYPADDISHDPDEEDTDIYVNAVDTSDEPTPDSELGETANGNNSQTKNSNEFPVIFPFMKNLVVELAGLTMPVIQE